MRDYRLILFAILSCWLIFGDISQAGMPAVLPTDWTKDHKPSWVDAPSQVSSSTSAKLQALSFFVAVLLGCAWAVKGLWQVLRKDIVSLPPITSGRALSFVVLWGLLFVTVLTMISGARELMTPGAWRKQGWTYKLAESLPAEHDSRAARRQSLEQLRLALLQYAAKHQGEFPAADEPAIDGELWNIPGWSGVRFMYVPGRQAEDTGRLLVFEPELEGDERHVILTNGLLGTMRSSEIRQALAASKQP